MSVSAPTYVHITCATVYPTPPPPSQRLTCLYRTQFTVGADSCSYFRNKPTADPSRSWPYRTKWEYCRTVPCLCANCAPFFTLSSPLVEEEQRKRRRNKKERGSSLFSLRKKKDKKDGKGLAKAGSAASLQVLPLWKDVETELGTFDIFNLFNNKK